MLQTLKFPEAEATSIKQVVIETQRTTKREMNDYFNQVLERGNLQKVLVTIEMKDGKRHEFVSFQYILTVPIEPQA